jgi:hypothetical protein
MADMNVFSSHDDHAAPDGQQFIESDDEGGLVTQQPAAAKDKRSKLSELAARKRKEQVGQQLMHI